MHAVVIVLGDLGRSPRMQYHALSLLQAGHSVTFIGYTGEALIPHLLEPKHADRLRVIRFTAPKVKILKTHALLFYYAWRMASLTVLLSYALFWQVGRKDKQRGTVDLVLVQNPPAMPLLLLAVLYTRVFSTSAKLVIDWHNVGYSMISLRGPVLAFARWYECTMAPYADAHLVVTTAMQSWLQNDLKLPADQPCVVVHDSPPVMFRMRTTKEQHAVLQQYLTPAISAQTMSTSVWQVDDDRTTTLLTVQDKKKYKARAGRPALIVTSTSYTPDEDLQLLLNALVKVDAQISNSNSSELRIVCAITGKGPLYQHYTEQISKLSLHHVLIVQLWIDPPDYPKFMACADLGISLHTSTSGMDLPIKILDYFGCEVPVAAYEFECLHELVQDGVNGRTFTTAPQLATILWDLLSPLNSQKAVGNHDFGDLKKYSLQIQGRALWSENWPKQAQPLLEGIVAEKNPE